ncbi:MAG TPA: VWA domain-containing protein [Bryobacteraceae bacterium]|nr:VWA domain-containing protein [Bryobacteraceae bacterium]
MRRTLSAFLSFTLAAWSQQVGTNVQSGAATPTFTTGATLVIETVTVNGKDGKPIEGLTAKDFTITEDNQPQTIKFFEYQKLEEVPTNAPAPAPRVEDIRIYEKLTTTQIAPEPPGDLKYREKRLLALYFDMASMPQTDQLRALAAGEKFIRTQMTASDLVAIMKYSGAAVNVLQDFTDDKDRLLSMLETLAVGEGQGNDENPNDASSSDTGAAFGQDDSEFNIFNTDRQLSALQTAANMLGRLNEKKALIYFASGMRLNGVDNQAQLRATENAAIRAGVSIWTVDARGLVANAPMGDATRGSPGGAGMYNGQSALATMSNFQRTQDTLWALAEDTGGKALLDNNDLGKGIVNAQKAISSYYILGYYTTNTNLDGKFRRVKITLGAETTAKLDYRQGYFAGKKFGNFTAADKERQLEDALMLQDPVTELTIAMEVDFFQLNGAEYFVPILVKIPGRELALAKKGGAEHTLLDFIGEVKDSFGTTVSNLREKMDIKLSDATAAELAKKPIEYPAGFTTLPGKYTIKFLARDAETGRIGTFQTTFIIPNLDKQEKDKEQKRVPISSVVLSSQRVDMKDALYNAAKDKGAAESVNPLVQEGQKLIPSVTRVFSKSRDMYVYLQAYEQGAETIRPLVAFISFYQGQTKAFETPPMEVKEALNNRIKTMPIKFDLALTRLPPGEYNFQVTVLDPQGQKAAFWQAPVMLVP